MSWKTGEMAEDFVMQRLKAKGWTILSRNFRRKGVELDFIVSREDRLICIEVKARSTHALQHPARILSFRKIERLKRGMNLWLQSEAPEECRNTEFWLCSVLLPTDRDLVEWSRIEI